MMVRWHEGSGKSGCTDETEFAPEPVTSDVHGATASRALISLPAEYTSRAAELSTDCSLLISEPGRPASTELL